MGPNGSGKSTLANTLLGHPAYEITEGTITFKGEDITEAEPHERAKAGLFLAFQYPAASPACRSPTSCAWRSTPSARSRSRSRSSASSSSTRSSCSTSTARSPRATSTTASPAARRSAARSCRWRCSSRDVAILDETDSGLDIDALRTVAEGVQRLHDEQGLGALIITHYQRILHYVKPEFVHILMDGRIVLEGGVELVERLEREGYDQIRQEVGAQWCLRPGRRSDQAAARPARPRSTARRALHGAGRGPATGARSSSCARRRSRPSRAAELPSGGARASGRRACTTSTSTRSSPGTASPAAACPRSSRARCPRARAGRIVQSGASVVHVELDPELAERGVILCSLEDAFRDTPSSSAVVLQARLTIDRHKLEAANAAFWSGGAFLHVPTGVVVEEPVRDRLRDRRGRASRSTGARSSSAAPTSDFRVHEYDLAEDFEGQALHAGAFELYLQDGARCRLAQVQDWGAGEVFDVSTRFVGVGRDAYCHWLPALLGGHLVRQHLELAVSEPGGDMAFRGLFFTEEHEHLDVFAVDLHETGPVGRRRALARRRHRREPRELRGPDPDRPGRAADAHLPADPLDDALAESAHRRDPLGARSADDVSASHGGTVGELDETAIFYMQTRGLDRPARCA